MDFSSLQKDDFKSVTTFNGWFHKYHLEIPRRVRPCKVTTLLFYDVSHDSHFSLFLREGHSSNLDVMFDNALELECNMVASDMLCTSHSQSLKKGGGAQESHTTLSISNHVNSCLQK
jgi:hypothetical protein